MTIAPTGGNVVDLKRILIDQLSFYWESTFRPRLDGLSDVEYMWEPVPGCWSLRPSASGYSIDWVSPEPNPAPVTTIAWRLAHITIGCLGARASSHFGDGALNYGTAMYRGTAKEAIADLDIAYESWSLGINSLEPDELLALVGAAEPGWETHSMAELIAHINREVMHHGAEICLLRDLYLWNTAAVPHTAH